jgi:hypothetical protein
MVRSQLAYTARSRWIHATVVTACADLAEQETIARD